MCSINKVLAECPGLGRIRLCECNAVHVTIGPVTINLEPAAFQQLAVLVSTASRQLSRMNESQESTEHGISLHKNSPSQFVN